MRDLQVRGHACSSSFVCSLIAIHGPGPARRFTHQGQLPRRARRGPQLHRRLRPDSQPARRPDLVHPGIRRGPVRADRARCLVPAFARSVGAFRADASHVPVGSREVRQGHRRVRGRGPSRPRPPDKDAGRATGDRSGIERGYRPPMPASHQAPPVGLLDPCVTAVCRQLGESPSPWTRETRPAESGMHSSVRAGSLLW